jgi:Zn-dependent protease with chaperone function
MSTYEHPTTTSNGCTTPATTVNNGHAAHATSEHTAHGTSEHTAHATSKHTAHGTSEHTATATSASWPLLYALTVACEIPTMLARYCAALVVAAVALHFSGAGGSATLWAKLAACGPIVWSALALLDPRGGGWWWRQRAGGRLPSQREHELYENAIAALQSRVRMPLPLPASWFVLDLDTPEAAVYGHTLMLSRGALALNEDAQLQGLIAHELGHLQSIDTRLTVAVNRLMLKPCQPPLDPSPTLTPVRLPGRGLLGWTAHMLALALRGGLGLRLRASAWGALWREQEYAADAWAAGVGAGEALADFLQTHTLELDHPIPLVGLTSHTHPPTELRIDRLRQAGAAQKTTAQAMQPPATLPMKPWPRPPAAD